MVKTDYRSAEPVFKETVKSEWFLDNSNNTSAKAFAFIWKRHTSDTPRIGCSQFKQEHSDVNPTETTVGHMPLILAPAHDVDTLNTVVKRCKFVADKLGQTYVVLTVL